ncbi:calpain-7-like [Limulus polyphemus]|uniref:Calpain-7-like n=1 Tax=Limulus polyphemus TaxID=6850 RepID=A0ABM1TRD3_LIMPO|nr:calpain-7-like [Limulus polyphemus]
MNIKEKAQEYLGRAEALIKQKDAVQPAQEQKNVHQQELERAQFLLHQAFDEDSDGNKEEAVELYSQAVELCLKARKQTQDAALQKNLTKLAEQALERAEALKGVKEKKGEPSLLTSTKPVSPLPSRSRVVPPLGIGSLSLNTSSSSSEGSQSSRQTGPQVCGRDTYTKEELEVLRLTSIINGREYVPFMLVDLRERYAYPLPFSDKDGKLTLSHKQKNNFNKWVRPEDISANPKLIEMIDCFSIKQTIVSDCSFVASLAISALYEKRFKRRIITSIIYPQNRQGEPVYNPCGKYIVKLHINGVRRKVIIDDKLPLGRNGELLCSYSNNRNEFWVSLLEKSYLKVMGGYDFPGSNSNIDLHALTGWIPERIPIRPNDSEFNKENVFKMLFDRHHKGDVLVTMATGEMSDVEAERTGLVPTHAYAMLDVREIMSKQLFLLKNPWSHVRWKGNFSELDTRNWTPKLQEALKYDPRNAKMFDNGVFWIDYESICRFYDIIYLNWNPNLFKYTFALHQ